MSISPIINGIKYFIYNENDYIQSILLKGKQILESEHLN